MMMMMILRTEGLDGGILWVLKVRLGLVLSYDPWGLSRVYLGIYCEWLQIT